MSPPFDHRRHPLGSCIDARHILALHSGLLALLALGLGACSMAPANRGLGSVHQPQVTFTTATLDLARSPGGGLSPTEAERLDGWFAAIGLGPGDHVGLAGSNGDRLTAQAIEALALGHGAQFDTSDAGAGVADPAPAAASATAALLRVTVRHGRAEVPGCPDWSHRSSTNYANATSPGYGCATAANLAAMVVDKSDLVHGQPLPLTSDGASAAHAVALWRDPAARGRGTAASGPAGSSGGSGSTNFTSGLSGLGSGTGSAGGTGNAGSGM